MHISVFVSLTQFSDESAVLCCFRSFLLYYFKTQTVYGVTRLNVDVSCVSAYFCLMFFLCLFPPEKLDEMLAGGQQEVVLRARPSDDFRAATVKQRPTSRRITQAEINVRPVTGTES